MGQKGLKLAFWAQNSRFLADFFLNGIGGYTPPPLNGQSLCSKKLSGHGGYPPPHNGQNPLKRFWKLPLVSLSWLWRAVLANFTNFYQFSTSWQLYKLWTVIFQLEGQKKFKWRIVATIFFFRFEFLFWGLSYCSKLWFVTRAVFVRFRLV